MGSYPKNLNVFQPTTGSYRNLANLCNATTEDEAIEIFMYNIDFDFIHII